jgi:hypothetical protein
VRSTVSASSSRAPASDVGVNCGVRTTLEKCETPGHPLVTWGFCCALGGIRTPNLLIRSQMLYPLSYERLDNDE